MNAPVETDRGIGRRDDRGESLVELLVSIAILGIAVVAILGAISMSSSASSLHRGQAQGQNLLRNWAENVAKSATTGGFWACPATVPDPDVPTDYTFSSTVAHWSAGSLDFSGSCSTTTGLRRVSLQITAPSTMGDFSQTTDVVVRKPCGSGC